MALTERNIASPEQTQELSFIHTGELPVGTNIEAELEQAMQDMGYNGTLEYWQEGAEVGQTKGYSRAYFVDKLTAAANILRSKRDNA